MKNFRAIFFKYVFQNILSMVGVSVYILADTFFISKAAGADGLTVLNLSLPIYGLIFAIGSLIGVGSATRFALTRAQGKQGADGYFSNGIFVSLIVSIPFMIAGIFFPGGVLKMMGGTPDIVELGKPYARLFLSFAPFFMCNYSFSGFVRNDNGPTIAMIGSLAGSLFNIVFDYVFMFPLNMGLAGAALATIMAPVVSMLVCSIHFFQKKNTIKFIFHAPSLYMVRQSVPLGVSAMIAELASAITTTVFNFVILGLVGNIGVAAYGVIANFALVAVAIFNGISLGGQPLLSKSYGQGDTASMKRFLRLSLETALVVAVLLILLVYIKTDDLICIFNSEGNTELASYAYSGIRLYFPGYLFAGLNLILIGYFSAVDQPKIAFVTSVLRGCLAIVFFAFLLSRFFGMTGVWLSFLAAEAVTFLAILVYILIHHGKCGHKKRQE